MIRFPTLDSLIATRLFRSAEMQLIELKLIYAMTSEKQVNVCQKHI